MTAQPIGLASDLAPEQVMRARVGQLDLAVWRSASGVVSGWENRCPHRGMRLSHGFVRGESLACAYHGWHYQTDGQCHYIPAHPALVPPSTICAVRYDVEERHGLLWLGKRSDVDTIALPDDLQPLRSFTCQATFEATRDALETVVLQSSASSASPDDDVGIVEVQVDDPCIVQIDALVPAGGVYVACQQRTAQHGVTATDAVTLHVLVATTLTGSDRLGVSRWCDAVQRAAESPGYSDTQAT